MTPRLTLALSLAVVGLLAFLATCGNEDGPPQNGGAPTTPNVVDDGGGADPATESATAAGDLPQWVDVALSAGITAENHSGKPQQKDWIVSGMGGGSIVLDYDADGDMDLCVVDGTMLTSEGELKFNDEWRTRLYRNDGGLKFTDVTEAAGIDVQCFGFGGASCDYDGDGYPDIFVAAWGRNFLLHNRGDGTFEDVTTASGLSGDKTQMSTACAWGDVNGDGIHDIYISNYIDQWAQIAEYTEAGRPGRSCDWRGFKVYCGPPGLEGQTDNLYLGNGDGTFRDVSETHLKDRKKRYAFQCMMTDVDSDGDLDIYVANDTQSNTLWVNDGTGKFSDRAVEAGVAMDGDVKEQAGMGVDVADVDRDGKLDLFVTNFSHDYNTLYINQSRRADAPLFADKTHLHDLARLSFLRLCWGTHLFDMDFDGDLDMFVACGHVYGEIDQFTEGTGTTYAQKNLLLRNKGAPRYKFEDVTEDSGPAFQVQRVWRGAVFADFDDDGDEDVFVTSLNGKPALYRNDRQNDNGFLRFRLEGAGALRDPSGALVTVTLADGVKLVQERHNGASFCSDNDSRLFFGVGGAKSVPQVDVRWPDGTVETFKDVATSRAYRVKQGSGALVDDPLAK